MPPKISSRLTVVEHVYYQQPNSQPSKVETKFIRFLASREQPYFRKLQIGEEWQPLDIGWIKEAGHLVFINEEGLPGSYTVYPTPEEAKATTEKVLELAIDDCPFAELHPTESLRFSPLNLARYSIRCRKGTCNCSVTIFPA